MRALLLLLGLALAGCGSDHLCRPEEFRCDGAVVQACSAEGWTDYKTCPSPTTCFIDFAPCSLTLQDSCCR